MWLMILQYAKLTERKAASEKWLPCFHACILSNLLDSCRKHLSVYAQISATWRVPEQLCSWNTLIKHGGEIVKCGSFQNHHTLNLSPLNGLGLVLVLVFFFFWRWHATLFLFLLFKGLVVPVPISQKDVLQMREKDLKVVWNAVRTRHISWSPTTFFLPFVLHSQLLKHESIEKGGWKIWWPEVSHIAWLLFREYSEKATEFESCDTCPGCSQLRSSCCVSEASCDM